jgi:hypothetical protein
MDDTQIEDWLHHLQNYYRWAEYDLPGQGIQNKGYGNVMDCFPEIGQLGTLAKLVEETEGISLLVTLVVFEAYGHLSEGITYIVRTERNALL